jgi:hypothetical protein
MSIDSLFPPATRAARRRSRWPRGHTRRVIFPAFLVAFATFVASAQAHTGTATTACSSATGNSVTFNWSNFANPAGTGNGGRNTPEWKIAYTPTGGATTTTTGEVSFPLNSASLTIAIPGRAGRVVASSAWTSSQTTDGNSNSFSDDLTIPRCVSSPTIVTTASPGVLVGGTIEDQAVLSGGNSPTGTVTFHLYAQSDTTCSTVLSTGTATVSGNGSYASPVVTETTAGSYQWTATYSGDANNAAATDTCGQAAEQVAVSALPAPASDLSTPTISVLAVAASVSPVPTSVLPPPAVTVACVASPVHLTGVIGKVRNTLSAHLIGLGVKSVTFYLDGRKLLTVTNPRYGRFSITINATRLAYGAHRLVAKATVSNPNCGQISRAGTFVRVKSPAVPPVFAG